jgi:thermostable 8-oxoguanine DNA glycosylase
MFREVATLKQELQKTKGALDISNGKLRLKEELAMTAIAAQEAAEKSLQLIDSRGVELRRRIEELTRQLEEAEKRERNSRKVRRICWPWQVFRLSSSNIADSRIGNSKRMLPEMQSFLQ